MFLPLALRLHLLISETIWPCHPVDFVTIVVGMYVEDEGLIICVGLWATSILCESPW